MVTECIHIIEILDEGGTLNEVKPVNLQDQEIITEVIVHEVDKFTGTIPEIRELAPKINDLQLLSTKIAQIISPNLENPTMEREVFLQTVGFYIKQSETLFSRINEIENKISYDINKNVVSIIV